MWGLGQKACSRGSGDEWWAQWSCDHWGMFAPVWLPKSKLDCQDENAAMLAQGTRGLLRSRRPSWGPGSKPALRMLHASQTCSMCTDWPKDRPQCQSACAAQPEASMRRFGRPFPVGGFSAGLLPSPGWGYFWGLGQSSAPGAAGMSGGCNGLATIGTFSPQFGWQAKPCPESVTVAILAQGTHWAVAVTQAFF